MYSQLVHNHFGFIIKMYTLLLVHFLFIYFMTKYLWKCVLIYTAQVPIDKDDVFRTDSMAINHSSSEALSFCVATIHEKNYRCSTNPAIYWTLQRTFCHFKMLFSHIQGNLTHSSQIEALHFYCRNLGTEIPPAVLKFGMSTFLAV